MTNHPARPVLLPQAQQIAAYLPTSVVAAILRDALPPPGRSQWLKGAVLFADVSGFTRLAEELATDGPRGAEELNRLLRQLFDGMIAVIHRAGGSVSHFYGDAMLVHFAEEDMTAAARAAVCAAELQRLMARHYSQVRVNRLPGKRDVFGLSVKIGLGYGDCLELIVGDAEHGMEFVLAGPGVEQATAAEKRAAPGQIAASATYRRQLKATEGRSATRDDAANGDNGEGRPIVDWSAYEEAAWARVVDLGRLFMPPALVERLSAESLPIIAEHRPVTNLFVQFDGIHLTGPTGGRQLQTYYLWACDMVARYAPETGRVNRILTGDKGNQLHIIFGAPVAPHSPEQALRCALAMQRDRPPFITGQRIGFCLGNVFAGPLGAETRREYTIVGDIVNLAARLSQACRPDEVWLDSYSANRLQPEFEFDVLPAARLKGKSGLVPVCHALREHLGTASLTARFRRFNRPLIAREAELAVLSARLDSTLNLEGNLTVVTGPAGVGKSHLLAMGVAYWLEGGGTGFVGACQPHLSQTPFGPWLQIWQAQFGLRADMTPDQQVQAVQRTLQNYGAEFSAEISLWRDLFGLPLPLSPHLAELSSQERQARFFEHVRRCLMALADQRPLLIVLEDVHLADEASLALVDYLADRLAHQPLGLLLSSRDTQAPLSAFQSVATRLIPLENWQPEQARLGLQRLLKTMQIPPELVDYFRLNHDTRLNPFFLEEAVRVMRETGALVEEAGYSVFHSDRFTPTLLPDSVSGLLLARLDRLPAASRRLLQLAAVIGEQFDGPTLAEMPGLEDEKQWQGWLAELVSAEILEPISGETAPAYLFRHALMRDAAYQSLPFRQRRQIHAVVAASLARRHAPHLQPHYATLAYHYSQADAPQEAFHYAAAAGQDAYALYANREAIRLYDIALAQLPALQPSPDWVALADIHLMRGHALMHMGYFAQAQAGLQEAVRLAKTHEDHERRAASELRLAELLIRQARYAEAQRIADDLLAQSGEQLAPRWQAMAYRWSGYAAGALGQADRALAQLRQGERICLATGADRQLVSILDTIAYIQYLQSDLDGALHALQRSAALARRYSTPFAIAESLNNVALIQRMIGQYAAALTTLDEALALAANTSRAAFAGILGNKGSVLAALGQLNAAQAAFGEAISLLAATDDEYYLVEVYLLFALEYYCALADWRGAADCLERARRLIAARPESYGEEQLRLWLGLAWIAWGEGDYRNAHHWLDLTEPISRQAQLAWWQPALAYIQGLVAQAEQRPAVAARFWQEGIRQVLEEHGCPAFLPLLYLALAENSPPGELQRHYFEASWQSAQKHARHLDRLRCARAAGAALASAEDPTQRASGLVALAWAAGAPSLDRA